MATFYTIVINVIAIGILLLASLCTGGIIISYHFWPLSCTKGNIINYHCCCCFHYHWPAHLFCLYRGITYPIQLLFLAIICTGLVIIIIIIVYHIIANFLLVLGVSSSNIIIVIVYPMNGVNSRYCHLENNVHLQVENRLLYNIIRSYISTWVVFHENYRLPKTL